MKKLKSINYEITPVVTYSVVFGEDDYINGPPKDGGDNAECL